jgi:ABC-type nitrate/sulfonate/bicarbonate transport system ATPase subunit
VRIDGEVVSGPDPRRIFVFPGARRVPVAHGRGNIGFGLFQLAPAERQRRIAHYVSLVGLQGFEKAYPRDLSGGMKQRVEVARALAVNPDMLLPRRAVRGARLDHQAHHARELLRIWEAERKTILFVTHDIDEAVQLADRVIVMSARPARIQRIVSIDIPHPRDISSRHYLGLRDGILEAIGLAHKV